MYKEFNCWNISFFQIRLRSYCLNEQNEVVCKKLYRSMWYKSNPWLGRHIWPLLKEFYKFISLTRIVWFCSPQSLLAGMNKFLGSLAITFRRDPHNFRPRINKLNSVKVMPHENVTHKEIWVQMSIIQYQDNIVSVQVKKWEISCNNVENQLAPCKGFQLNFTFWKIFRGDLHL